MELRSRTTAALACGLWLVTFGCCAAGLLVTLAIVRPLTVGVLGEGALYAFFFVLGSATVGLVLALRRPENPIGWLYSAAGLAWLSLPPAAVCVVLRFRSSGGVERQQLRWVAAGVAAAVAGLLIALPGGLGFAPGWISNLVFPALLCPPVAVAVAVLRYRLYDLDRVVSRTLSYALLTVLLGLGYAAVVLGLGRLLPEGSSLAVAAATLAAAVAFSPLRRRVQAAVDQTVQPTRASLWLRGAPR